MTLREIFRVNDLPVLQNKMFSTHAEALACPTGDIVLVQDMDTGLVFNSAFDAARLDYDKDYQNEQACSGVFQQHLQAVTKIIGRHFKQGSLIEVGCGKGYFLEHLHGAGYDITGIDPAYEGDNPSVVKARFERGLGLSADGVILRHVLEHVPDPVAFLSNIAEANGGKGDIYIEVPCFDWICGRRAWFDLFYEHVNYFRLSDLGRMFGKVHEAGHLFGGQYLYLVADLSSLRTPRFDIASGVTFPVDFLGGIGRLSTIAKKNARNAIWGGTSKGVIFAIYMENADARIDLVIDINPAKQGLYLARSGLLVSPPAIATQVLAPHDNVFVMNSNYLDEIVALSGNQYQYIKVDHE